MRSREDGRLESGKEEYSLIIYRNLATATKLFLIVTNTNWSAFVEGAELPAATRLQIFKRVKGGIAASSDEIDRKVPRY